MTGVSDRDVDATGTPRWVKVLAIIALVVLALVVVLLVTGHGGGHGPGRHTMAAETLLATPLS
jgi:ABC-type transporter Mla subunit MlaD